MEIFVFYQKIIRALVLYFLLNLKATIQKMSSYKAQMRKKNLIIYQYQNHQETQAKVKEKKKIIRNTFKKI